MSYFDPLTISANTASEASGPGEEQAISEKVATVMENAKLTVFARSELLYWAGGVFDVSYACRVVAAVHNMMHCCEPVEGSSGPQHGKAYEGKAGASVAEGGAASGGEARRSGGGGAGISRLPNRNVPGGDTCR